MSIMDWDVDQYKTEHECDEHWELRRSFLLAHKDKFPEDRLICLAQVFTNVEFLGCRYPAETMQLIDELSQGVADDYREKQKSRLQRTFVKASDAAGAKAKGLKRPLQDETASGSTTSTSNSTQKHNKATHEADSNSPVDVNFKNPFKSQAETSKNTKVTYGPTIYSASQSKNSNISSQSNAPANGSSSTSSKSRYGGVKTYHINQSASAQQGQTTGPGINSPYGKLVLVEPANEAVNAMQTLQRSAQLCHMRLRCEYKKDNSSLPPEVICTMTLNGKLLSSAKDAMKKNAHRLASEEGLKILRESCYTIKTKLKFLSDTTIDKSLVHTANSYQEGTDVTVPVADSNIGSKLLRLMGWTGGGLGKDSQGIEEPVSVHQQVMNRAGLGLSQNKSTDSSSDDQIFKSKVHKLMREYANSDSQYDLVFSADFSSDERKVMHEIAMKFKLKTKSYGKQDDRHLVVSKKRDMWQTLEQLLQSGGSTERYDLLKPTGPTTE